jgi:hypothetical protein
MEKGHGKGNNQVEKGVEKSAILKLDNPGTTDGERRRPKRLH